VTLKRHICALISSGCDRFLKYRNRQLGIRILLYHSVGTDLPHDTYGVSMSVEAFKEQIRIISEDRKIEVIPLRLPEDSLSLVENDGELKITITFDDAYRDNLYTASPVLLEWGVPFTVFVTAGFLKKNSSIYLSIEELKELSGLPGITVGSHGMTERS